MIGRPKPDEAAPHFAKYIALAPGDDPIALIESQLESSLAFFQQISEERSRFRYAPDKWSIKQVLSHSTDTERAFSYRALWFGRGFSEPLVSFNQETAAAGAEAGRLAWTTHVDDFRAVRQATITLFRNLPEAAWGRGGVVSGNPITVRALAYIIVGHLAHHNTIIQERYLAD